MVMTIIMISDFHNDDDNDDDDDNNESNGDAHDNGADYHER